MHQKACTDESATIDRSFQSEQIDCCGDLMSDIDLAIGSLRREGLVEKRITLGDREGHTIIGAGP